MNPNSAHDASVSSVAVKRGKTILFGVFKRDDRVYTQIVPDVRNNTLLKAIRGRVSSQSIIHSDG